MISEQAYPPQGPAGYDHSDLALFDIVGPTPIFRPHPARRAWRPRVLASAATMTVSDRMTG
jgi:hypothetical protein